MLFRQLFGSMAAVALTLPASADDSQRFEAEEVLVNRAALPQNQLSPGWDIWSTDRKGAWSKDVVIRGGDAKADRKPQAPESGLLTFRIPLDKGAYQVSVQGGRSFAVSADGGKTFKRIDGVDVVSDLVEVDNGQLELKAANCYVARPPNKPGPCYIDFFTVKRLTPNDVRRMKYPEPVVTWRKPSANERIFEAEDVLADKTVPADKLVRGRWEVTGNRYLSGGKGMRSVGTKTDLPPSHPDAARIKFLIPVERGIKYDLVVFGRRNFGISFDGKNFKRITGSSFSGGEMIGEGISSDSGFIEFYAADCFATIPNPGNIFIDCFKTIRITPRAKSPQVKGFAVKRLEEALNRGVAAIPTPEGAYISWRLLRSDATGIGFEVFRQRGGKAVKLNSAPVVQTCDFTDTGARPGDVYQVKPVNAPQTVTGQAKLWDKPYRSFKLQDSAAKVMRVGVGDLNGDGEYDYVFKTPDANIDPWSAFWYPTPEPYKLEAHLADGTLLWSKSYGWGIERGVWYSPFIVYDFNGDGKAEIALKMGEGDPGNNGRIFEGPEYLVILDGMTGKEIARAPWPSRDGFENYNLVNRNQLTMAYLDGKTPCVVALRGTYGEMKAEAWQLKNGKLEALWKFDNRDLGRRYQGQGAHSTIVGDFDGDGRDEILLGSMVLDDNGDVLWSTGMGHPDYIYYTDIMPENPGLEVAFIYETPQSSNGVCIADAKTGRILWGLNAPTYHVNDGYAVDFDPTFPGAEVTGIDFDARAPSPDRRWRFTGSGRMIKHGSHVGGMIRGVYWDADLEKEVCTNRIKDFDGGPVDGTFSGGWVTTADLFGDWREEIITSLPGEVRIYPTTIPAMDRRVTLMQEHSYRTGVSNNSQGYKTDASLPYLPALESPNFSLIVKTSEAGKTWCQVTAAPSRYDFMRGEIRLTAPTGVKLTPDRWTVNLKPGEISITEVKISGSVREDEAIRGELTESGGKRVLRTRALLYRTKKMTLPADAIKIPAAKIATEKGGQVMVVKGRPGADDGTVLGWDARGHALTWKLNVPNAGRYRLAVQYATPMEAQRTLTVNGKAAGKFDFAPSGGFGNETSEWDFYEFSHGRKPLIFDLRQGSNEIVLENADGGSLNLAYWFLIPQK